MKAYFLSVMKIYYTFINIYSMWCDRAGVMEQSSGSSVSRLVVSESLPRHGQ